MLCPRFLSKASALSSSTRIAASLHSSAEGYSGKWRATRLDTMIIRDYSDDVRFAGLDGSFECPRVTTTAVPGPRTQVCHVPLHCHPLVIYNANYLIYLCLL